MGEQPETDYHSIICERRTKKVRTEDKNGVWALHRDGALWSIDHVPSGGLAGRGSEVWARSVLARLGEKAPEYGANALFGSTSWAIDYGPQTRAVSQILRVPPEQWARLSEEQVAENLAAEWETRANCATAEVERLTGEVERLRDAERAADSLTEKLQEQLSESAMTAALEAQTSADLRAVNDVLRAQLAEAARAGAEWVTDGNTLRLVVRRVTEASVGAVVSSDRGADWTVRVSGGPSAQGFQPGDCSTEQAKRIVETVSGVRP